MTAEILAATEHLVLRRMTNDDDAALAAYRSDPVQARYQSWETPYPLDGLPRWRVVVTYRGGREPLSRSRLRNDAYGVRDLPGQQHQVRASTQRSDPAPRALTRTRC